MDQPKRIAILSKSYFGQITGGAELQLKLLAEELAAHRYDVHYIFQDRNKKITDPPVFTLHHYSRLGLPKIIGNISLPYLIQILYLLIKIKPDVIIARPKGGGIGVAATYCRIFGSKLIWHLSSTREVEPFRWKKGWKSILKYLDHKLFEYGIKHADVIVGQAQFQCKLLQNNFQLSCSEIIPNFYKRLGKPSQKSDKIRILWVANFKPVKQPELFITLARDFTDDDRIEFVMVGRNPGKKIFNGQALPDNVRLTGELELEKVDWYMSRAHILVNTSISEGFPNTFIQAWLNEMLVLSLNVDPDNIMSRQEIGFKTNTVKEMAAIIQNYRNHPAHFTVMRKRARKYALQNHTKKNVEKYFQFIG